MKMSDIIANAVPHPKYYNLFDSLPSDIILYILTDYLILSDICNFDTAISSSYSREQYLNIIKYHSFYLNHHVPGHSHCNPSLTTIPKDHTPLIITNNIMSWLHKREIYLKNVIIDPKLLSKEEETWFDTILSHTEYIALREDVGHDVDSSQMKWIKEISHKLSNLRHLPKLTQLNDDCLSQIQPKTLETIELFGNHQLSENSLIEFMKPFPHTIQRIAIKSNQMLSQSFASHISCNLHHLQDLILSNCKSIQYNDFLSLSRSFPQLTTLDLSDNGEHLTDEIIVNFSLSSPKLQNVFIGGNDNITDTTVLSLANHSAYLLNLRLGYLSKVTNTSIIAVLKNCQRLQTLLLHSCIGISTGAFDGLKCPNLKPGSKMFSTCGCGGRKLRELYLSVDMDIDEDDDLFDEDFFYVAYYCPRLEKLDVENRLGITDVSIQNISINCKKLNFLDISYCHSLTYNSMKLIAAYCHCLKTLNLSGLEFVNRKRIEDLLHKCKTLTELRVNECENFNEEDELCIMKAYPHVKIFHD